MEALSLRRWACVLAVGGAVLAGEIGEAAAGAVAVATPRAPDVSVTIPFRSAAEDGIIARCVSDSDATRASEDVMSENAGAAPMASFLSVINGTVSAGAPMSFPTSSEQARTAAAAAATESFDVDDGSGSPRIPPATLIPLPPGVWTGIGTLGGLGLISAGRRVWRML